MVNSTFLTLMGRVTGFRVQGKPKTEDCDLTYPHKLFVVVVDQICQYFGCFVVQLIQQFSFGVA